MTRFSKLAFDGGKLVETEVRDIQQSDLARCPHVILVAEHYRPDGSCKCNDPGETVMAEWGYIWQGGRWESGGE